MFKEYYDSFLLDPPVIMGLQMLPLTLGHTVLLESIDCPFYTATKKEVTNQDLIISAIICSKPWQEVKKMITSKDESLINDALEWGKNADCNWAEASRMFTQYLIDYIQGPEYWKTSGENKKLSWQHVVAWCLQHYGGYTKEQAWNEPVCDALWNYAAIGMINGGGENLVGESDREMQEALSNG